MCRGDAPPAVAAVGAPDVPEGVAATGDHPEVVEPSIPSPIIKVSESPTAVEAAAVGVALAAGADDAAGALVPPEAGVAAVCDPS